jgi:D-3-phosphoglycerate dehydrogenase
MKVVAFDPFMDSASISLDFIDGQKIDINIDTISKEDVLKQADFLTLHVPAQDEYVIGSKEIETMKDGAFIANAARGGVVDEVALLAALESGKLSGAALDVFETEPKPAVQVLMNNKVSLTPHIGAATGEAQDRIGGELATQIIELLK